MQLGTGDFFITAVHIAFESRPETQHSVKPRVTTEHPRETSLECKTLKTSLNIQITPRGEKSLKPVVLPVAVPLLDRFCLFSIHCCWGKLQHL